MGRAYGDGHVYERGVFRGKRALLSLTTGGQPADYQAGGQQGELAGILWPLHRGILQFTGFTVLAPHVVYGPARLPHARPHWPPGQRGCRTWPLKPP